MSLTKNKYGSIVLGKERAGICINATWELEALALVLPGMAANKFVVRGIAGRILQLSEVLLAGLYDYNAETESLISIVMVAHEVTPTASAVEVR